MSDTAKPKTRNKTALKAGGVFAAASIKIPTTRPDIAAVSSDEKIATATKSAKGNIGFALRIFKFIILLYCTGIYN